MERVLEAIYESGVFRPLESVDLPEHQQVILSIHPLSVEHADTELEAWQQVYSGLSDQDIAEMEAIALDRSRFMDQQG
jgi:predicted DNA-binding antitoxin AbrB/MazE fold protein